MSTPFNFAQHLLQLNAGRAAKTAYIDDHGRISYGELAERVKRLAGALQAAGLRREERVLLLMHDHIDWPVSFLACLYAGIVPVAVNTLLTADFPQATVAALKKRYNCPVLYLSGAVGGLLAPSRGNVKDAAGNELHEGDYEYARVYGEMIAELAARAVDAAEPATLAPFAVAAKPIAVPVENSLYRVARAMGVLKRPATVWTGEPATKSSRT